MKVLLALILLILLSLFSICARGQSSLEIEVVGLRSNNGIILLQVFDKNEKIISQVKGVILEKKSIIVIKDLKPGRYAFRFFHDENLSGIMETGTLGIPKEGYGFSNDASGPFGPKPFNEWLFEINGDKKVTIKTRYH
jgi:uncharacterized protein (DUF2141 family)